MFNRIKILFSQNKTIILILVIGIALRLILLLCNKSFIFDETYAYWNATNSGGIINLVFGNYYDFPAHPFLSYVFIHFMSVVSTASIWLRLLPFLFSILTLPIIYLIGKVTYGKRIGIILLVLFSFSSYLIYFSSILKVYSQLMFFQSIFLLLFIRQYFYGQRNSRRYFISGLFCFATDYSFIWLFLSLTVFTLIFKYPVAKNYKKDSSLLSVNIKRILFVHLLILICGLPWLTSYLTKLQNYKGLDWLTFMTLSDFANGIMKYSGIILFEQKSLFVQLTYLFIVILMVIFVFVKYRFSTQRRITELFLTILILPNLIIIILNFFIPFYADYNLMVVIIPLFVFLALLIQRWFHVGIILLVIFLLLNLNSFDSFLQEESFQDWQSLSNYITMTYANQKVALYMYPWIYRSSLDYYQKLKGISDNKPEIIYSTGTPTFGPIVKNLCVINRTYNNTNIEKLAQSAKTKLNMKYKLNKHKLFGKIEMNCYSDISVIK